MSTAAGSRSITPCRSPRTSGLLLFALAADLLELGEHGLDAQLIAGLLGALLGFRLRLRGSRRDGGGQQRGAARFGDRLLLGGALHLEVEIDLRAETKSHRIERLKLRGVPVRALADALDRRFRGTDKAHDLRVLELRMVAHQPENGIRPVL